MENEKVMKAADDFIEGIPHMRNEGTKEIAV